MKKEFDDYEHLSMRWDSLQRMALSENAFDSQKFLALFQETFAVLQPYSTRTTIDRELMDLVFNISGFVATRMMRISYEHAAATELAEAMIHCCLYEEPHKELISQGKWYILNDVVLDFTKPDKTLADLAADMDRWDEIAVG